ncbi:8250_t:CDS:2, partial [Ambispora leptoticha]
AFLNDETQESYEWVLQQTLDATSSEPNVFIKNVYKNTYHIYCIWHLFQNLPKRLKSKLDHMKFKEFINKFWKARNSLSVNVFEQQFQALIEKYPNAHDYLYNTLYPNRQSWACAFINKIFTAGMQSTQHVESINAFIHKEVSSSSSMIDVIEAIDFWMQKEALNASFITWKYKSLIYHQPFIIEKLFKIGSAIEFNEDKLNIDQDEAVKDYYDFWQTYLKTLMNS